MNAIQKMMMLAFMIFAPLSLFAMDKEDTEEKPLFEPIVSNGRNGGWQLGGEIVMEPHELAAANKAQADTMIDRYFATKGAVINESDFDLTGTRFIKDDPRLFSSNPDDRFHAQIKDFPEDIKERAVMHYARSEIITGMSVEKADEIAELYRSEVAKRSNGAYESMVALLAKSSGVQNQESNESKK
jgi:hypothetical protein